LFALTEEMASDLSHHAVEGSSLPSAALPDSAPPLPAESASPELTEGTAAPTPSTSTSTSATDQALWACPPISHAPGYDRYQNASLAHEAGYDAFMTGSAFIRMMHRLGHLGEQKPLPHVSSLNIIAVFGSDFQLRLAARQGSTVVVCGCGCFCEWMSA
jgi:hypothetical protein